jgi:hypothetical protein
MNICSTGFSGIDLLQVGKIVTQLGGSLVSDRRVSLLTQGRCYVSGILDAKVINPCLQLIESLRKATART